MEKVEEISRTLKENKTTLKDKYKFKEIGIFGSWVRGEQRELKVIWMFLWIFRSL